MLLRILPQKCFSKADKLEVDAKNGHILITRKAHAGHKKEAIQKNKKE